MGQLCSCTAPQKRKLKKRERRLSDDASTHGAERSRHDHDGHSDSDDHGDDSDEIHIIIDGGGDGERDTLLAPAVVTKRTSKSALISRAQSQSSTTALAGEFRDTSPVDPHSAVEQRRNMDVLRSYQKATGVVDPGQADLECVVCLDTFDGDNPKVRTLCNCGVNRTNFHLSCLLEWLNRDANCPVCRQYLFYEEP